ncbi:MAG: metal transporter [Candidatus Aenigmarchaeota archaeon]|nr:metal transporter [Candidatus Aenigmarchaeota archaeon]
MRKLIIGVLPVVLLVLLIASFLQFGPLGLLKTAFPPVETVAFEKVVLEKDKIAVSIINDGPDEVTISQVLINDAYNQFHITQSTLKHLEKAVIYLEYPWSEMLPLRIKLVSSSGVTFEKEIPVATPTPVPDSRYIISFALIGLYVGVIPVFLGLLWLPLLKNLSRRWYDFFLSLTVGLLIFLLIDALEGAFELAAEIPQTLQGVSLIAIGVFLPYLTLLAIGKKDSIDADNKSAISHTLRLSYMISLAIGLHNMGEGLAIGSAFSVGEITLGSLLVIGFMMHNVTEGIAIIAPIAKQKGENTLKHLLTLGLIAGGPTIIGAWIGGFVFSQLWSLLFLSVGVGAILYVVVEIVKFMKRDAPTTIFTFTNIAGFLSGLFIMYVTGLFVF